MSKLPDLALKERIEAYLRSRNITIDNATKSTLDELVHEITVYHEELHFQNDELKRQESSYLDLKNNMKTIMDTVSDLIVFVDSSLKITLANKAFHVAVNKLQSNVRLIDIRSFIDSEDQDKIYHALNDKNSQTILDNIRLSSIDANYKLTISKGIGNSEIEQSIFVFSKENA